MANTVTYDEVLAILERRFDYYSARVILADLTATAGLGEKKTYASDDVVSMARLLEESEKNVAAVIERLLVSVGVESLPAQEPVAQPAKEPVAQPAPSQGAGPEGGSATAGTQDKEDTAAADKKAAEEKAAAEKAAADKKAAEEKAAAEKAAADKKAAEEKAAAEKAAAEKKAAEDKAAKIQSAADAPATVTVPVKGTLDKPVAAGTPVVIQAEKEGLLHWGVNGWKFPPDKYHHAGAKPSEDGGALQSPLKEDKKANAFVITVGPFDAADKITEINYTFAFKDGSWGTEGKILFK